MNAAAIRVLLDYNAWAHAQIWKCVEVLSEDQFTRDIGYSVGSIRNHLVHVASVDARWFAHLRGTTLPNRLDPENFANREDVSRLWSVVYSDLDIVIQNLTDGMIAKSVEYTTLDEERGSTGWEILLHVVNHGTDHRAQMLYMLHKMGVKTLEQDFVYYLRDELPPRGFVKIDPVFIQELIRYDIYATSRLVSECLVELSDADLDKDFGYSHRTVRAQLAHIMMGGQYWLERAFDIMIDGNISTIFSEANRLTAELTSKSIMEPMEYTTSTGQHTANIRWEMLWHLINHGTDHRAQTLAMLHELKAPTFEQDMMIYWWDYRTVI